MNNDRESFASATDSTNSEQSQFSPYFFLSQEEILQIEDEEIRDFMLKMESYDWRGLPNYQSFELGNVDQPVQGRTSVPFVDPAHLAFTRKSIVVLCAIALVSEMSDYPIFQVLTTKKSYMLAGVPLTPAWVMALIFGGIFDTYVNVRSENVANDAFETALALFEPNQLPSSMMALLRISQVSSLVSFVAGSCGNLIGLMAGVVFVLRKMFPDVEYDEALPCYASIAAVSALLCIPSGVAYYAVFNIGKFNKSFAMLLDFTYAEKRDLTLSKARTWACMLEAFNVVIFRSISFAAIIDEALHILFGSPLDKNITFSIVCIVFVATVISVLSTRVIQVIDHYTKDEYLLLDSEDINRARDSLTLSTYFRALSMNRNSLLALVPSFGLAWLLKDFSGMDSPLMLAISFIVPVIMFLTYMTAQYDKTVLEAALEAKKNYYSNNDLNWEEYLRDFKKERKVKCMNTAFPSQGLQESFLNAAGLGAEVTTPKDLADELSRLIGKRFKNEQWIKCGLPACVAFQVFGARGISFLQFANQLKSYIPVEFNPIALFLLTGPINMFNWYDMFLSGVQATLLSRRVESYIMYSKAVAELDNPPSYHKWRVENYSTYWGDLFFKGIVSYNMKDAVKALQRIDRHPPQFADYSCAGLFRRVKSWFVSDSRGEELSRPLV